VPRSDLAAASAQRRHLIAFAALSASYFAHIGFFNPYLPLWLKDMGLGVFEISLLIAVQSATRLFAPYAWGALSDHTGERVKLLRLGASVALITSLGLFFGLGFWSLAAVLLLMFTHTSFMMSMSEAAMAHLVRADGAFDARRYGRVRLWGSLGFLVTVLVAGVWFEIFGMTYFPAVTSLTLLAVVISAWRLPDLKEAVHSHEIRPAVWRVLRKPAVRWLFASLFFHVLAHMSLYVFFSLYMDFLGYSKTVIGLLWAVSVLAEIAWFYTQSRWLPCLSLSGWLVLCAIATVLRMGVTATSAAVLPLLVLAQMLHAITFAAHHSVVIALLSHHFPGRLRGRGQALYTVIGYGFSGVLGSLGGGALSAKYGLDAVFVASAAIALVATGCAWRVWRGQDSALK
jgi:MFS transporter, PPP family, 3-phenylpropionic acid transporter